MNTSDIKLTKTSSPKVKPDPQGLDFGSVFTDHMFIMDYEASKGWHSPRIVPYAPIALDPAAAVLHYAQEMFEGLKTYKTEEGKIQLFRPDMNAKRTNLTNERLCIPEVDENFYVDAIRALVEVDKDWVPNFPGTSLYIRPFIFANEPFLGVRPSNSYLFAIILSPVGPYYKGGLTPTKIWVEDEYVRAAVGGTGFAKVGGNYASSLKSQMKAHDNGYTQVLWLDSHERRFAEEIGTSNAFFVVDGAVYTAPLSGTILPGITRDSAITLLRDWGVEVHEKSLSIDEIYGAHSKGILDEVFASGTAAVISPVGELSFKGDKIIINEGKIGKISQKLYDTITGIQSGRLEDVHKWTLPL